MQNIARKFECHFNIINCIYTKSWVKKFEKMKHNYLSLLYRITIMFILKSYHSQRIHVPLETLLNIKINVFIHCIFSHQSTISIHIK